jgi:hypothetical protein
MRRFGSIAGIIALAIGVVGLAVAATIHDQTDASADSPTVCIGRYIPAREVDPSKILPNADPALLDKLSKRTAYEMTLFEEECFDSVEEAEQAPPNRPITGSNDSIRVTSHGPWYDIARIYDYENFGGDQY